ncbi:MAG: hypothetical protein ABI333_18940 [bacterium]
MKLQRDLREFIALLNSHGVEYLLVGGHAVAFHGYPRYTGDIDFFIRPSAANAARMLAVLSDFGFGGAGLTEDDFTRPGQVVQLGQPPNRIDILTQISGVEFDEAWVGAVVTELDELPTRILGRDALLKNKGSTDRAKDRADVEELLKLDS